MRIKSIKVLSHFPLQEDEPILETYYFNDDCQLVLEERKNESVEHRYLLDGNEYEKVTRMNGETIIHRYEYDDEGDLIGEVEFYEDGTLRSKTTYNWIKPERVVDVEIVEYEGKTQSISKSRWYYRKDGRHRFTRGDGSCMTSEYDDSGHFLGGKVGIDIGDGTNTHWAIIDRYNEDGLLIEHSCDGIKGTMTYEYDEYGNWVRMEGRIMDGPVSIVLERIIDYAPGVWTGKDLVCGVFDVCHITKKQEFRKR